MIEDSSLLALWPLALFMISVDTWVPFQSKQSLSYQSHHGLVSLIVPEELCHTPIILEKESP